MDFNGALSDPERRLNQSIGDYLLAMAYKYPRQIRLNFSTPVSDIPGTMAAVIKAPAAEVTKRVRHGANRVTSTVCSMHRQALKLDPGQLPLGGAGERDEARTEVQALFERNARLCRATCGVCWNAGADYLTGIGVTLREHDRGMPVVIDLGKFRAGNRGGDSCRVVHRNPPERVTLDFFPSTSHVTKKNLKAPDLRNNTRGQDPWRFGKNYRKAHLSRLEIPLRRRLAAPIAARPKTTADT